MSEILLPYKPRRGDPDAAMTVQKNVDELVAQLKNRDNARDSGSVTITSGNTSVAVAFTKTLVNPHAVASPIDDPAGRWWLSAKSATGFTINLQTAAGVGGVDFDWHAEGDK